MTIALRAATALLLAGLFARTGTGELAPDGKPKLYIGENLPARLEAPYAPNTIQTVSNRLHEILSRSDMLGYARYSFPPDDSNEIARRVTAAINAILDYSDSNVVPRSVDGPATKLTYQLAVVKWTPNYSWQPSPTAGNSQFVSWHTIEVHACNFSALDTNQYFADVTLVTSNAPVLSAPAALRTAFSNMMAPLTLVVPLTNRADDTIDGLSIADLSGSVTTTQTFAVPPNYVPAGAFSFTMKSLLGVAYIRLFRGTDLIDQVPVPWHGTGVELPTSFPGWSGRSTTTRANYTEPNLWSEAWDPWCNWTGHPTYSQWQASVWQAYYVNDYAFTGLVPRPIPLNFATFTLTNPAVLYPYASRVYDGNGRNMEGIDWFNPLSNQLQRVVAGRPFQSIEEMHNIPLDIFFSIRLHDQHDRDTFRMVPPVLLPDGTTGYFHRVYDFFTMSDPFKPTATILMVQ